MTVIQDVTPPPKRKAPTTESLIQELWRRGISLKDIFATYYAMEAAADGRSITVEEAELIFDTTKKEVF